MTEPLERDAIYLKRRFDAEIMVLCVRWYVTDRDAVARSVAKFDLTGGARALIDIAGRGGEG